MTNRIAVGERADKMREKTEQEPITCPKCFALRLSGSQCPKCGYKHSGRSRLVVQADGKLRQVDGEIYKQRRTVLRPDTVDKWRQMYYRAKKSRNKMTFNQAVALFAMENNWGFPPRDLPLMPVAARDFYLPVRDVPTTDLR